MLTGVCWPCVVYAWSAACVNDRPCLNFLYFMQWHVYVHGYASPLLFHLFLLYMIAGKWTSDACNLISMYAGRTLHQCLCCVSLNLKEALFTALVHLLCHAPAAVVLMLYSTTQCFSVPFQGASLASMSQYLVWKCSSCGSCVQCHAAAIFAED
jgi:hypothetical protein